MNNKESKLERYQLLLSQLHADKPNFKKLY